MLLALWPAFIPKPRTDLFARFSQGALQQELLLRKIAAEKLEREAKINEAKVVIPSALVEVLVPVSRPAAPSLIKHETDDELALILLLIANARSCDC